MKKTTFKIIPKQKRMKQIIKDFLKNDLYLYFQTCNVKLFSIIETNQVD